jgi:hypothetical protein
MAEQELDMLSLQGGEAVDDLAALPLKRQATWHAGRRAKTVMHKSKVSQQPIEKGWAGSARFHLKKTFWNMKTESSGRDHTDKNLPSDRMPVGRVIIPAMFRSEKELIMAAGVEVGVEEYEDEVQSEKQRSISPEQELVMTAEVEVGVEVEVNDEGLCEKQCSISPEQELMTAEVEIGVEVEVNEDEVGSEKKRSISPEPVQETAEDGERVTISVSVSPTSERSLVSPLSFTSEESSQGHASFITPSLGEISDSTSLSSNDGHQAVSDFFDKHLPSAFDRMFSTFSGSSAGYSAYLEQEEELDFELERRLTKDAFAVLVAYPGTNQGVEVGDRGHSSEEITPPSTLPLEVAKVDAPHKPAVQISAQSDDGLEVVVFKQNFTRLDIVKAVCVQAKESQDARTREFIALSKASCQARAKAVADHSKLAYHQAVEYQDARSAGFLEQSKAAVVGAQLKIKEQSKAAVVGAQLGVKEMHQGNVAAVTAAQLKIQEQSKAAVADAQFKIKEMHQVNMDVAANVLKDMKDLHRPKRVESTAVAIPKKSFFDMFFSAGLRSIAACFVCNDKNAGLLKNVLSSDDRHNESVSSLLTPAELQ